MLVKSNFFHRGNKSIESNQIWGCWQIKARRFTWVEQSITNLSNWYLKFKTWSALPMLMKFCAHFSDILAKP